MSIPDIMIWMICNQERVGYARINPCDVFFSQNSIRRGHKCWKKMTIDLKEPATSEGINLSKVGKLQMFLWFGLKNNESEWKESIDKDMQMATHAETYENQCAVPGTSKWTELSLSRPHFSDITGRISLQKNVFTCPTNWRWNGDWFVYIDNSSADVVANQKTVIEEIYENESRIPGMNWGPASTQYTSSFGDASDIELESGWSWVDDWSADLKRAVDEYGWEYSALDGQLTGYSAIEKLHHMCRRRRLLRTRTYKHDGTPVVDSGAQKNDRDGWEYATLFNTKFHKMNRKMDLVRRRRWLRRMVCDKDVLPCTFLLDNSNEDKSCNIVAPTMTFQVKTCHKLQLRAYIFQGRGLMGLDHNGLSDSYMYVVCNNQCQRTMTARKTISPTWDQTLVFNQLIIYETVDSLKENLIEISVELFDQDKIGKDEFIGHCAPIKPSVRMSTTPCKLHWYPVYYGDKQRGEILAAFELINLQGKHYPLPPQRSDNIYSIPLDIRPVLEKCNIEILAWGLRDMKSYQLLAIDSPSCEVEIGGVTVETKKIRNFSKKSNFSDPILTIQTNLPQNPIYCPPINIRVRDNREFGWKPIVALSSITNIGKYRKMTPEQQKTFLDLIPVSKRNMSVSNNQANNSRPYFEDDPNLLNKQARASIKDSSIMQSTKKLHSQVDWWSKFYASTGNDDKCGNYNQKGFDTIQIYDKPLEDISGFSQFRDFCETFDLYRGKANDEENDIVGQFKGSFRILPAEIGASQPNYIPFLSQDTCLLRVYVVKAMDLQSMDRSGLSDPYLKIQIGSQKLDNQSTYVPNTLNPFFGRMFELKAQIPENKNLVISVMDYDLTSKNDLIGKTVIDLEDRLLTTHRATCGLPKNYYIDGPNVWRDSTAPKEILDTFCRQNNLQMPTYFEKSLKIGDRCFFLEEFEISARNVEYLGHESERLALHVLNAMPLVKEHVETRPIFNDIQPDIEQGKVMLWVDIFPLCLGLPGPPIDISVRKPQKYELRVIILNTADVLLTEESVIGREMMSDIYVRGWIAGIDSIQKTDIHYRSLDGEGNFNWRYIFKFDYFDAEGEMVVKNKEHYWSLNESEQRLKPRLLLQIWDNDKFSADDFIGMTDMSLQALPKPTSSRKGCDLGCFESKSPLLSLFEHKRIKGFWPCYNMKQEKPVLAGKIEMELELLTEEEALERPTGLGRSEPNKNPFLAEPNRPATSFLWFTSPFKSFRYIIWKNYKWHIITGLVLLFIVGFIFLIIYAIPGATVEKIIR